MNKKDMFLMKMISDKVNIKLKMLRSHMRNWVGSQENCTLVVWVDVGS